MFRSFLCAYKVWEYLVASVLSVELPGEGNSSLLETLVSQYAVW